MQRRSFLLSAGVGAGAIVAATGLPSAPLHSSEHPRTTEEANDRDAWVKMMRKTASPLLAALADDRLKTDMPVRSRKPKWAESRKAFTYLEGFARLLSGIGPWLDLPPDDSDEGKLRSAFFNLAHRSLTNAVSPQARDFMNFTVGTQPLVDAAFLALALYRAPRLWNSLDASVQSNVIAALTSTRAIKPYRNNWLLFSAMVEAFLHHAGQAWEPGPVNDALQSHVDWYCGDGLFGDGPEFHWDYYNSFVIHPFMRAVLSATAADDEPLRKNFEKTAARWAEIQERLIAPDGSFPAIGRSVTYRCGAFHHLANEVLVNRLPASLAPGQVRAALFAVLSRTLGNSANFDANGWLIPGLSGDQPLLAEGYISTGSLYLAAAVFLPLGLPADHAFWISEPAPWTSQQLWGAGNIPADSALTGKAARLDDPKFFEP